jgi:hypothetical protein
MRQWVIGFFELLGFSGLFGFEKHISTSADQWEANQDIRTSEGNYLT